MHAPDARVIALDVDAGTTQIARRYWEEAGVADRVDLRIGPALDALDALIANGEAGTFDFAFIDADKPNYPHYVDRVTELLRPGGVMLLDNMLWSVLEQPQDAAALLDQLSRRMTADERLTVAVLPLGSGMTAAVKNG
jgi:caffeoyl-CoA O-methyltransferase